MERGMVITSRTSLVRASRARSSAASMPSTTPISKMIAAWFAPITIVKPSSNSNTRIGFR